MNGSGGVMRAGRATGSRAIAGAMALALVLASIAIPASAAEQPYVQHWRMQNEVGGDIGGRSALSVTESAVSMEAAGGTYAGSIAYGDRLVVEAPQGGVLVQVSTIRLTLDGTPAAGGSAAGGLFEGTARLDDYLGLTWDQATSGQLPDRPSRSGTYSVAGRWGAWLAGSSANGELLFESANITARAGDVDIRDASWFNGFGRGRAQTFTTSVKGNLSSAAAAAAASPGGTAGTADYVRAGLAGESGLRALAAVPLESSLGARALRDAKPKGATALPRGSISIDLDVSGLALDAKNRAAGQFPASKAGVRAAAAWHSSREASSAASVAATGTELLTLLGAQDKVAGVPELERAARAIAADESGVGEDALSVWLMAARAVSGKAPSVLAATAKAAASVRDAPVARSGPLADALLADSDSLSAPRGYLEVDRFARTGPDDVVFRKGGRRVVGGGGIVREALGSDDPSQPVPEVRYMSAGGPRTVAPDAWLAYRRGDDMAFWLAGPRGAAALREGTLAGWAYESQMVRLVSATRCGQTLAIIRIGSPHPSSGR